MKTLSGHVFWLFGLPSAGKSTLAETLALDLRNNYIPVLRLDGDRLREGLCTGLGFTDGDRWENLRRAAEVAKLGAESQIIVVASFITPKEIYRNSIRGIIGKTNSSLVFVNAPIEVCRQRDVKGLYARASAGSVVQMTGVSSLFELPAEVDLELETARETVTQCTARLSAFARSRLRLPE